MSECEKEVIKGVEAAFAEYKEAVSKVGKTCLQEVEAAVEKQEYHRSDISIEKMFIMKEISCINYSNFSTAFREN